MTGSLAPRKRALKLVLQQHVRGRFRKVGAKRVSARRGRFRASFVPAFSGPYRYALSRRATTTPIAARRGWISLRVRR